MHFYITKYRDDNDGKYYAESWCQIDIFGKHFCLLKRKIEIYPKPVEITEDIPLPGITIGKQWEYPNDNGYTFV